LSTKIKRNGGILLQKTIKILKLKTNGPGENGFFPDETIFTNYKEYD
jgi:hypothetical protein